MSFVFVGYVLQPHPVPTQSTHEWTQTNSGDSLEVNLPKSFITNSCSSSKIASSSEFAGCCFGETEHKLADITQVKFCSESSDDSLSTDDISFLKKQAAEEFHPGYADAFALNGFQYTASESPPSSKLTHEEGQDSSYVSSLYSSSSLCANSLVSCKMFEDDTSLDSEPLNTLDLSAGTAKVINSSTVSEGPTNWMSASVGGSQRCKPMETSDQDSRDSDISDWFTDVPTVVRRNNVLEQNDTMRRNQLREKFSEGSYKTSLLDNIPKLSAASSIGRYM